MPRPKPRKVGDPNNQTVDAFRGVSAEAIRAKRLAKKTPAGQADRIVSYDPAAVRAAIDAQLCPFCGAGPYKVVAVHTNKIHGIDRHELRELAGLNGSARVCAQEFSDRARELAFERDLRALGELGRKSPNRRTKYRRTTAGAAACAENIRRYNEGLSAEEGQEQRRHAGAARAAQQQARDACGNGHTYTPDTTRMVVREDGRAYRACRTCERDNSRLRHGFAPANEVIDGIGTFRRMQALACIGHSIPEQARRIGKSAAWAKEVVKQMRAGAGVLCSTADAVAALYEELRETPAAPTKTTRTVSTKALRRGWLPPSAWTGAAIDAPMPGAGQ